MARDEYAHDDHRYEPKYHEAACETQDVEGGIACGAEQRFIGNDLTVELPGLRRVVVCVETSSVFRLEPLAKAKTKPLTQAAKNNTFHGKDGPIIICS
jgi:hypothetical protein